MKNLLVLLALMLTINVSAQRAITDTLKGSETVVFESMQDAIQVQVNCVELGGTSDGALIIKGSVDGVVYTTLTEKTNFISFFPSDTLSVSSGATWLIGINKDKFNYYSIEGVGTVSDTTKIDIKWSK